MRILERLEDLPTPPARVVLAAGVFDGVHLGHQKVIETALQRAREQKAEAWVMTFEPHPLRILHPARAPALITSLAHKLSLIESLGIHGCLTIPFTLDFAALEPDAFLARLTNSAPAFVELVVGTNWTFGHRASGDVALLQERCGRFCFQATLVEGLIWKNEVISSTRIRRAVSSGHLAEAASMLGRPFSMLGTVVHGKQLGRKLGFPTANLDPHNEVFPPAGIYATWTKLNGKRLPGATFLGARYPAHDPARGTVEVHLIDTDVEVYGQDLEVEFVERIRDEQRFSSQESLRAQIAKDVDTIRQLLNQKI